MMAVAYTQLLRMAMPEVMVVVTALVVVACDLLLLRGLSLRVRFRVAAALGVVGCVAAMAWLAMIPGAFDLMGGVFVATPLIGFVQVALLGLTVFTLLLSVDSSFTEHVGEFVLLVLLATVGMMFLVATQDILVIFLSLELLSLSLYVMTALDKASGRSAEAGLKYFLFGGMSAAFLLFGFSLLYGLANSTNLGVIAASIHVSGITPLLVIAMVTTAVGFGFKVAAAPFHFWAPDVYEAAPAPAAGFIASASKVASFFVLFQFVVVGFAGAEGSARWGRFGVGWTAVLAGVAALSMVWGNLAAIRQRGLRRLMAYSAVAHAGYMLVAVVAHTPQSLAALLYYVVTYGLATLGVFGVIAVVERQNGDDALVGFDGLVKRAPVMSGCLFVFLLSLAGIPPLAGFFGKFYLFVGALQSGGGLLWLVVLAIAMSAVSLYYYLQVLKRVFVTPGVDESEIGAGWTGLVVVVLAVGVVVLGCAPGLLLRWIAGI
jgi:NADH-quinone oxidoreductase subunit N